MFSAHCPNHGGLVLMSTRNIEKLVNGESGIDLRYRCSCGYRGTWHAGPPSSDTTHITIPPEV